MTIELGFNLANLIAIACAVGSGIGSYVAVKVDLAKVGEKAAQAVDSARTAHARIDGILSSKQ